MRVQVKLFGIFCEFSPPGIKNSSFWLDMEEVAKPKDIFARLKIPGDLEKSIICNGRVAKVDQVIQENDIIAIFPPIIGG